MKIKAESGIALAALLIITVATAYNVAPVKAEGLLRILIDRNLYALGEEVEVTVENIGFVSVDIGGWPCVMIYTYPNLEPVWPKIFASLAWSLAPGESETWTWNQYNEFTESPAEPGMYVVRDTQGWGLSADFEINPTSAPSSLLASVKDYGRMVFGPGLWNGWVLLTFGVGRGSYPFGYSIIGDELTHHWWNGSTGAFDFTASNEPDFNDVVAYLTNGENDFIWLYIWCDGYGGGQGTSEEWWGIGDPDVVGFDIDFIRLRVNSLSISWLSTELGTYTSVTHDATWEIWGHLPATISVFPSTVNLKSNSKWITAYIELSENYDASNIDVSTVKLNGEIPAELHPTKVGDSDTDGITDLMVKFNSQDVRAILNVGEATLTISGEVNGIQFEGSATIRVMDK